jgi:hypothetical protein
MAKDRTQREWTEYSVKALEVQAKEAGLLPEDARLYFQPGSPTNGVSPDVVAYGPDNHRLNPQPYFIPSSFTIRDTAKKVERACDIAERVLRAVNEQSKNQK